MNDFWEEIFDTEQDLDNLSDELESKKRQTADAERNHRDLKEARDRLVALIDKAYKKMITAKQKHCESRTAEDESEYEMWRHIYIALDYWYHRSYEPDVRKAWKRVREAWREEERARDEFGDKLLELDRLRRNAERWEKARRERIREQCHVPIRTKAVALSDLPQEIMDLEVNLPHKWPDLIETLGLPTTYFLR